MAGTLSGGKAAGQTNKERHGADYYARIGAIGGKKGRTGGFYANRELARIAGAKGGHASKRGREDYTEFIATYNAGGSLEEVANQLGRSTDFVSNKAARLRAKGFNLKYMPRKANG